MAQLKTSVHLGSAIASRRKELGLTQFDVGSRIGFHPNIVSRWECGEGAMKLYAYVDLCAVLEVPLDYFVDFIRQDREEHGK